MKTEKWKGLRRIYHFLRLLSVYKPKVERKISCTVLGNPGCSFAVALANIQGENPIIYSFGVGEDNSFDMELLECVGGQVFAFDPTPKSIEWVNHQKNMDKRYSFYPYGLSDKDEKRDFFLPQNKNYVSGSVEKRSGLVEEPIKVEMKRLQTIMRELGHTHLDLLKMDIEGSEFQVIPDILNSGCEFDQLCIEIHGRFFQNGNEMTKKMFRLLNGHGYRLVFVSPNYEEYTFIRDKLI